MSAGAERRSSPWSPHDRRSPRPESPARSAEGAARLSRLRGRRRLRPDLCLGHLWLDPTERARFRDAAGGFPAGRADRGLHPRRRRVGPQGDQGGRLSRQHFSFDRYGDAGLRRGGSTRGLGLPGDGGADLLRFRHSGRRDRGKRQEEPPGSDSLPRPAGPAADRRPRRSRSTPAGPDPRGRQPHPYRCCARSRLEQSD
ncbi:hypothetical protein D3C72_1281000 [compost metagenome]